MHSTQSCSLCSHSGWLHEPFRLGGQPSLSSYQSLSEKANWKSHFGLQGWMSTEKEQEPIRYRAERSTPLPSRCLESWGAFFPKWKSTWVSFSPNLGHTPHHFPLQLVWQAVKLWLGNHKIISSNPPPQFFLCVFFGFFFQSRKLMLRKFS